MLTVQASRPVSLEPAMRKMTLSLAHREQTAWGASMAMSVYRGSLDVPPPTRTVLLAIFVTERDGCWLVSSAKPTRSVRGVTRATAVKMNSVSDMQVLAEILTIDVWRNIVSRRRQCRKGTWDMRWRWWLIKTWKMMVTWDLVAGKGYQANYWLVFPTWIVRKQLVEFVTMVCVAVILGRTAGVGKAVTRGSADME